MSPYGYRWRRPIDTHLRSRPALVSIIELHRCFFAKRPDSFLDFVDSMDEANYVTVALTKPMGIVFEENDAAYGGIFVQSLKEDSVASEDGTLKPGDQLVAVNAGSVSGMPFDDALNAIIESEEEKTKLVLFRGKAQQFYGPTGPSKEWFEAFCQKA